MVASLEAEASQAEAELPSDPKGRPSAGPFSCYPRTYMPFCETVPDLGEWTPLISQVISDLGVTLNTSRDVFSVGMYPTRWAGLDRSELATSGASLTLRCGDVLPSLYPECAEAILHELAHYDILDSKGLLSRPLAEVSEALDNPEDEEECYRLSLSWVEEHAPLLVSRYADVALRILTEVTENEDLIQRYRMAAGIA